MRFFIRLCFLLLLIIAFFTIHFLNAGSSAQQHSGNTPGTASCTTPPPGMVAWWDAEGSGRDIRGENNGTFLDNGVPVSGSYAPGEVGHAFSFDGVDDEVSITHTPALNFGPSDSFTVDAWLKPDPSVLGTQRVAVSLTYVCSPESILLAVLTDGKIDFSVRDSNGIDAEVISPGSILDGQWHHVVGVRDVSNHTVTLYLDGVAVTSVPDAFTGTFTRADAQDRIGSIPVACPTNRYFWMGLIDEVEVFSRALSPTEIQNIFNAGSLGKCVPRCTSAPSGLVSWWDGDDDPFDREGTNHGTLQGGATFADGKVGRAFSLNGTDAFIQLPRDPTLDLLNAGSLDAWVKFNQLPSVADHVMEIVGTDSTIAGNDFDLEADISDKFIFSLDDGERATSTTVIKAGVWYHVAGTWDSTGIRVYVNGVLENTNPSQVTRSPGGEAMQIGHQSGFGNTFFNGLIDEVEVFNRALSTAEVQAINNGASAGKCKPCLPILNNTTFWWPGDANAKEIANGFNGTLQGGAGFGIGKVGQAFSFTGSGADFVSTPPLTPGTHATLSAWLNPSILTGGFIDNNLPGVTRRTAAGAAGNGADLTIGLYGGMLGALYKPTAGVTAVLQSPIIVQTGTWYHVAVSIDGSTASLYVNGVLQASAATSANYTPDSSFQIGSASCCNGDAFGGLVDEVQEFDFTKTQTEIQSIVAAGTSGMCKVGGTFVGPNTQSQEGDVTLTFGNVAANGVVNYQTFQTNQAGPMPFGFNGPLQVSDISTTASFTGGVRVCFNLQGTEFSAPFQQLRILHLEGNNLINRTSFAQFSTRTLCANVSSLSPFVIAQNPSLPTAAPASISGIVTDANGAPLAGATLNLSGATSVTTFTRSDGSYHFDNLESSQFYTVTPSLANYQFTPVNRSFSLVGDRTDAAFTGTADAVPTANAVDTTGYFVRQHYLDFLGREPDQGGFEYWVGQINQCNGDANCVRNKRIDVSASFFASPEFQQTGSFIYELYAGALGRTPNYTEFMPDRSQVIGGPNLEAARVAFADAFVQRPEFIARYPLTLTRDQFVDELLQSMTTRSGTDVSALRDQMLSDYDAGGRSLAVRDAVQANAFVQAEYNKAFVLFEYFAYLRRNPDTGGYDFWLDVLNGREAGNYRGMVCAFLTSTEYQQRFSSVVTHSNAECGR